jgi:hypothetical protein
MSQTNKHKLKVMRIFVYAPWTNGRKTATNGYVVCIQTTPRSFYRIAHITNNFSLLEKSYNWSGGSIKCLNSEIIPFDFIKQAMLTADIQSVYQRISDKVRNSNARSQARRNHVYGLMRRAEKSTYYYE